MFTPGSHIAHAPGRSGRRDNGGVGRPLDLARGPQGWRDERWPERWADGLQGARG